jgi:hypothetical protein
MAKAKTGHTKPARNKENQAKDQKRMQENQSIINRLKNEPLA